MVTCITDDTDLFSTLHWSYLTSVFTYLLPASIFQVMGGVDVRERLYLVHCWKAPRIKTKKVFGTELILIKYFL